MRSGTMELYPKRLKKMKKTATTFKYGTNSIRIS
jgi:hypothetical protein